ncbi:MAG TPA: DinB family protein [Blastocatellia bacterium]|nr:DinB family protein [Blastocatellia bacterium]
MQDFVREFRAVVEAASSSLAVISETESEARVIEGKWSKKEILGHLIDSASNNHQRFVRVQLTDALSLPGYEQNAWVETQAYQTEKWESLVALWRVYNLHLAHLVSHIPEGRLSNRVAVGGGDPVTLEFLIRDYLSHLKHHLGQIFN